MPIRDRITWGDKNPLSDPRYDRLDEYVSAIRANRKPGNVKGGQVFENKDGDLPERPNGYYREYDVEPLEAGKGRGIYRLVLGGGGDVYITGNHYRDFRQIINMPASVQGNNMANRLEKERNDALDQLSAFHRRLRNQVNLGLGEHKAQQALITDTSSFSGAAVGALGFWTNQLFNAPIPELIIWNNAFARLESAGSAIRGRDVKRATLELYKARAHYLAALRKFTKWKDGIEGAGVKMQVAIGVTAVVLIGAAVAAFAATAVAAADAAAGATAATADSAAAAEQTAIRVAQVVQRADVVIKLADATSLAEEEAAEDALEASMEEFSRMRAF